MVWLAVLALGAIGAVLRALLSTVLSSTLSDAASSRLRLFSKLTGPAKPGILVANVAAAFLLGLLSSCGIANSGGSDQAWRVGLMVGGLGALSTWSSLALEVAEHIQAQDRVKAAAVATIHLVTGVFAAWIGLRIGG